jgi:hypothetical protein
MKLMTAAVMAMTITGAASAQEWGYHTDGDAHYMSVENDNDARIVLACSDRTDDCAIAFTSPDTAGANLAVTFIADDSRAYNGQLHRTTVNTYALEISKGQILPIIRDITNTRIAIVFAAARTSRVVLEVFDVENVSLSGSTFFNETPADD